MRSANRFLEKGRENHESSQILGCKEADPPELASSWTRPMLAQEGSVMDDTPSRDTVVESLSAPVAGSRLGGATNYSGMVRQGIRACLAMERVTTRSSRLCAFTSIAPAAVQTPLPPHAHW